MRWIFYSLFIVNLVYLGLQLTKSLTQRQDIELPYSAASSFDNPLITIAEQPQPEKRRKALAGGSLCPVIGPWQSMESAKVGAIQLRAAGVSGEVRALTVTRDRLNWVYLPPYASRDRALAVLQELQERGVDSFVVKEGNQVNAISLGYFASAESAEGLRVKMRNAGYPVFVQETSREVTEYWIYLADPAPQEKPGVKAFLQANQGLELDRVSCG